MRRIHFIGGLPRSGSTLLTNILSQNPNFHSTTTSSLVDFLVQVRDNWGNLESHKNFPGGQDKWAVLNSILNSYHNTDKSVVFDKNRSWTTNIEFVEKVMGRGAKIIACVRNLEDVCTSFEKLFRKNRAEGEIHNEFTNPQMRTLGGRVGVWVSDEGIIGRAYVSLLDAVERGLSDRIFFLPYEGWTKDPIYWFRRLYEFLDEEYYQHDFENIQQIFREDDSEYGWGKDLHEIKTGKLLPAHSDAVQIIGQDWFNKLHNTEFWKK